MFSYPPVRLQHALAAALLAGAALGACEDDTVAQTDDANVQQHDTELPSDVTDDSDVPLDLDSAQIDTRDDPSDVFNPDTNLEDDTDPSDVRNPETSDTPDALDAGDDTDDASDDVEATEDAADDAADAPSDSSVDPDVDAAADTVEEVTTDVTDDADVAEPPVGVCVDTAATRSNVLPGFCPSTLTPPGSYRGTLGSNLNDFAGACGVTSPGRDGALRVAVGAGQTLVARYVHAGDGALHLLRSCPVVGSCLASTSSVSTCASATADVRSAIELRWTNPDATAVQVTLMLDSDALDGPQNFWLDLAIE